MKIAVYAGYYAPHCGGYCTNIHELAKRLVAHGHQVTVITCNTEYKSKVEETRDGVRILRLPAWDLLHKTYPVPKPSVDILRAWAVAPDVIVTQTRFFSTSLLGACFSILGGKPLIHVERGSVHTVLGNPALSFIARVYDHTLGTLVVKRAKRNIGISQAACNFIGHIGGKKAEVIFNGIEVLPNTK